jgi:hypothetical protein
VAVRTRADRTFPGEVAIVEALIAEIVAGNQAFPTAVAAIVLLEEVSEAAKRGSRATVVVQAARACPHGVEVEVVEASPVAEVEDAAVAVVDADRRRRQISK